jgi:hypothetical protein
MSAATPSASVPSARVAQRKIKRAARALPGTRRARGARVSATGQIMGQRTVWAARRERRPVPRLVLLHGAPLREG